LNQERDFEKVRQALSKAQEAGASLLMNEINIGEVYYILCRKRGEKKLAIVWRRYSLSFADCFAVSTARREKARILTGDPEFKKVTDLAEIEWIIP
jgi:predicted nucleic acid-binding protein